MYRKIAVFLFVAVLSLVGCGESESAEETGVAEVPGIAPTAIAPTPIPPADLAPDDLAFEQSVAELINQHRNANGLPPLTLATELTLAARRHSQDMALQNNTAHTGSDGSEGGQRMQEAGYNWSAWDEVIGWGFTDPESVVGWWMEDADHWPILLSDKFKEFGVGYYRDANSEWGHYWTVDFGTRNSQ